MVFGFLLRYGQHGGCERCGRAPSISTHGAVGLTGADELLVAVLQVGEVGGGVPREMVDSLALSRPRSRAGRPRSGSTVSYGARCSRQEPGADVWGFSWVVGISKLTQLPTFGKDVQGTDGRSEPDVKLGVTNGELRQHWMMLLAALMDAGHPTMPLQLAPAQLQSVKDAVEDNLAHATAEHTRQTGSSSTVASTAAVVVATGSEGPAAATESPTGPVVAASSAATMASGASNVEATASTTDMAGTATPAAVRDSGPGTPPTPAVVPNASANGPEDWESDNSSLWGDSDDDL